MMRTSSCAPSGPTGNTSRPPFGARTFPQPLWIGKEDLAGKTLEQLKDMPLRIGVSDPSSRHMTLFSAYLSSKGMTADQLKWRFLPTDNMASALGRNELDGFIADAVTTTYANSTHTGEVFLYARKGDMGPKATVYPSEVVVVNRGFLKEHPELARRFMKALADASALYASESRNEMISYIAEWTHRTRKAITPLFDRIDLRLGLTRANAQTWWELDSAAMKGRNAIPETMSFDDVFDLSSLP